MKYRGWMFIGFSKEYPRGKIKPRTFMHEDCLVFRTESGKLRMIEPYCSHFGVNMTTGKVKGDCIQCPMHGRLFNGDGSGKNPKHRSIRAYPVAEERGLVFAWFDKPGVAPLWDAPRFMNDEEFPDITWRHSHNLSLHHPSVPLDNAVDPRHFLFTHSMYGKCLADGEFTANGHKATGTMATQLTPPLSWATGDRADVTTYFDSPLCAYLRATVGLQNSDMLDLVTIINGKHCVLTQIGIGKKSYNPLRLFGDAVSALGSWYATREDMPVWNNRKVQEPDNYPYQTDKALEQFREWFEGFAYDDSEPDEVMLKRIA